MKYLRFLILIFCLVSGKNIMAQQTSLTVDNQSPGWLSSKIGFGDQLTVQRLKVTGYLNSDDIVFLKNLSTDRSLNVLDLEETHMVTGGSVEYIIKEDDLCHISIYKGFNLNKLIASKYAKVNEPDEYYIVCDKVDTLVATFLIYKYNNFNSPKRMLWLPEGVEELTNSFGYISSSMNIPSTMRKIKGYSRYKYLSTPLNIFSFHTDPEKIDFEIYNNQKENLLKGDTLWIPVGTKEKYFKTPFKNMRVIIEMIPPEMIAIDCNQLKLFKEESALLRVSLTPQNAYYKELTWETSDASIATVSQSGEVTAVAPGTAVISVSSVKNPEANAQCEVTVCDHTTGIKMASTEERVNVGSTITLVANTLPLGTSDNEVTWSSDDEEIATIDGAGNVAGIKVGSCVVKATAVDGGYTAECKITVVQPAKEVTLNKHETSIVVNNSETLKVTLKPDNTTDKTVIWSTSNADIAEVSTSGLVTAKKAGKAFVIATSVSNPEAKDSCEVTVIQPVEGIMLSETRLIMRELGEMVKLTANVQPEDASDKSVRWASYNQSVCTVTENGTVIAVGYGSAIIVATTVDGGYAATCVVRVTVKADVNADGIVDVADIATIIDVMAGVVADPASVRDVDVNGDGTIDVADIATIIDIMAARARRLQETEE